MYLTEQLLDNHLYLLEIEQILKNPELINEFSISKLKDWSKNKFESFAKKFVNAAKNKDLKMLKTLKRVIPKMSLNDINAIGQKATKNFPKLVSIAEKTLKKKAKNISKPQLKAASLAFALAATTDKNPQTKMYKMMAMEDEQEEIEITGGDVSRWILSAVLGVVGTIVIAQTTGVFIIFGPLILFGLFNALLKLVFGVDEETHDYIN